ncbi:hypothetical protein [Cupriavidus necator]|uniref:hypothetical protein n=1 Tax=Cupriavidus necator TaxID=106590 RepID=UPI00339D467C
MKEADIHGAIRGWYEGISDPVAGQQRPGTLMELAGIAHASMMVRVPIRDHLRDHVTVNRIANPATRPVNGQRLPEARQQLFRHQTARSQFQAAPHT